MKVWNDSAEKVGSDSVMTTTRKLAFANSLSWIEEVGGKKVVGKKENRVVSPAIDPSAVVHPSPVERDPSTF